jgi:GPI-GlcNAc transferase complex, PIG-H component
MRVEVSAEESVQERLQCGELEYTMSSPSPDARLFRVVAPERGQWMWMVWLCAMVVSAACAGWQARGEEWGWGWVRLASQSAGCWVLAAVGWASLAAWSYAVREESVLVVRHVVVQLTEVTNAGRTRVRVLDASRVRAVVMNETTTMCRFVFYIALVVTGESEVQPVFGTLLPPLALSTHVFHAMRHILHGEPDPPRLLQPEYDRIRALTLSRGYPPPVPDPPLDDRDATEPPSLVPRWQAALLRG